METTQRKQVTLPLSTIATLKALGLGRLSAGILVLVGKHVGVSEAEPQQHKPLTSSQLKDSTRREHMRTQMIETFRRAAQTRTVDPIELESLNLGITLDDIVPAAVADPAAESVDDLLAGWGE